MSNQDALSELMLLADRYEVDELKKIAEFLLISGVDDDSAIYLLSISDQINAGIKMIIFNFKQQQIILIAIFFIHL